jgi:hypothetical protein
VGKLRNYIFLGPYKNWGALLSTGRLGNGTRGSRIRERWERSPSDRILALTSRCQIYSRDGAIVIRIIPKGQNAEPSYLFEVLTRIDPVGNNMNSPIRTSAIGLLQHLQLLYLPSELDIDKQNTTSYLILLLHTVLSCVTNTN